ncbi:MAG: ATP-binding protein [Elusimicrobiales bacterium]|nr:ATP-binding protein [Elusimicrobiales bacterium]
MIEKAKLRQVIADQTEDIPAILSRCRVERLLEGELRGSLSDGLIKVISGVRRCGKSVLAHRVLRGLPYAYVNFDDERLADLKTGDLDLLLETLHELRPGFRYLLLDEIQNIARWELFASRLQRGGTKVVVTGSNAHLLSRDLATHLTGRHKVFEIYPYSFREYLRSEGREPAGQGTSARSHGTRARAALASAFAGYFDRGGFPELPLINDKKSYLRDLYDKVLVQDIAVRHGVRHIRTLRDIALYTADNFASRFSYKNIADAYSIGSVHTVKNYLSYMEEAYLFFAVEAFSHKARQRVRLPRKIYGIDTAMLRAISVSGGRNEGRLLENLVFLELLRRGRSPVYYSDARRGHEVDFLCRPAGGGAPEFIQVCSAMDAPGTRERELRALAGAVERFGASSMTIVTMDASGREKAAGKDVRIVPAWEWLLEE